MADSVIRYEFARKYRNAEHLASLDALAFQEWVEPLQDTLFLVYVACSIVVVG